MTIRAILDQLISSRLRRTVTSVLLGSLYFFLVRPFFEHIAFVLPTDITLRHIRYGLLGGFWVALCLLIHFSLYFFSQLLKKNSFYKSWAMYSSFYFALLAILLLLVYPGHWVWDEFFILDSVKHYFPNAWQNYFTNIFYTFSLYIFPSGISIVITQMAFISLVFGYIMSSFSKILNHKIKKLLVIIFFLSPVILVNNLYPLRLTVYSYLELLAFTYLLQASPIISKKVTMGRFIAFSSVIALLAFWRSEGLFLLALIPLYLLLSRKSGYIRIKRTSTYIGFGIAAIIIGGAFYLTKITSDSKYMLASAINPLSIVLQQPLKQTPTTKADLAKIDSVLNLQMVKSKPSYAEVPSFWSGAVRTDYKQNLPGFWTSYIRIMRDNPRAFFSARIKTFLSTNGLDKNTSPSPIGMGASMGKFTSGKEYEAIQMFDKGNILSDQLNSGVAYSVTKGLMFVDDKARVNTMGKFVWTVIPTMVIVTVAAFASLVRRQWIWTLLFAAILTRAFIIFITAPANYFMYYLPVYMSGYLTTIFYVFYRLVERKRVTPLKHGA